jgi:hypothetical protein
MRWVCRRKGGRAMRRQGRRRIEGRKESVCIECGEDDDDDHV